MRVWIKFGKGKPVRFISHGDIMRVMTRALRRARIPVAFSQGFNPHARLSFAAPLPVGATSEAEYMDLELCKDYSPGEIVTELNTVLPPGLTVSEGKVVYGQLPALMAWIERSKYRISVRFADSQQAEDFIATSTSLLEQREIPFVKKTKRRERSINAQDWIHEADFQRQSDAGVAITVSLQTGQHGNLKAEEFMEILVENSGLSPALPVLIHRLELYGNEGGEYVTPFDLLSRRYKE